MYSSLSIENILKFARNFPAIFDFFPEVRDFPKLPRSWICNMIFTLEPEAFKDFVKEKMSERNEKFALNDSVAIALDPEVA